MRNLYVLEWSKEQNYIHIIPLEQLLARNQECFIANRTNPYITLMVGDEEVCERMAYSWQKRIDQRREAKAA